LKAVRLAIAVGVVIRSYSLMQKENPDAPRGRKASGSPARVAGLNDEPETNLVEEATGGRRTLFRQKLFDALVCRPE
jgi:hypothetical protein